MCCCVGEWGVLLCGGVGCAVVWGSGVCCCVRSGVCWLCGGVGCAVV